MYVRQLTAEDKAKIKQVKELANKSIREQSKELTKLIQKVRKKGDMAAELRMLERERCNLQELLIIGSPVTVECLGETILLDYDLLKKLYRNLAKHRTVIAKIEGNDLRVDYRKGKYRGYMVLRGVNAYQRLAGSLPIINLY